MMVTINVGWADKILLQFAAQQFNLLTDNSRTADNRTRFMARI